MAIGYLEKNIRKSLEENKIVNPVKPEVSYKPQHMGENYRKGRQWLIKNASKIISQS